MRSVSHGIFMLVQKFFPHIFVLPNDVCSLYNRFFSFNIKGKSAQCSDEVLFLLVDDLFNPRVCVYVCMYVCVASRAFLLAPNSISGVSVEMRIMRSSR